MRRADGVPFIGDVHTLSTDNESIDIHDLTDGAGHGLLVATDNIWLTCQVGATAPGLAITVSGLVVLDIFYRFKKVTLQEYIGIVQSQQQGQ